MIAVLQRVTTGKVKIGDRIVGDIDNGLVILLGVHRDDKEEDIIFLADKVIGLRVFNDNNGKMKFLIADSFPKQFVFQRNKVEALTIAGNKMVFATDDENLGAAINISINGK